MRACLFAIALGTAPLSAHQLPADLPPIAGPAAVYATMTDRYEAPGRAPIELTILSKAEAAHRAPSLVEATKRSLAMFDEWLGPLNAARLTIVDAPWNSAIAGSLPPGLVVVRSRWISPSRDRALERQVIGGVARLYWPARPDQDEVGEGLRIYTAARAIDTMLEGSQFYVDRHFGGFLPYALRPIALSPAPMDARPRLRRYPELDTAAPGAQRIARGLEVAERFLGWPALQQAVRTFRERSLSSASDFAAVASEQRGSDVAWLFEDPLRDDRRFDYAVGALESTARGNEFDVRVTIERRGDGVFARPLPIEIRFADGSTIRDQWDPSQPQSSLSFVSVSPAVSAAIDPDVILVLDEQRSNNVIRHEPRPWNRLGLKLACDWAIWLQQAMLTYSGIA